MELLLSVIIPLYNAERTIERCIQSVLDQTVQNMEIILVDDGSTDSSYEICNRFVKRDDRIKLFHQINSGVSTARNIGLENAAGKYIQFVDSDDYISENMSHELIDSLEKNQAELVVAGYWDVKPEGMYASRNSYEGTFTIEEYAKILLKDPKDYYFGVLWNKMFHNYIVRQNKIRFSNEVSLGEDFIFIMQYCTHIKKVTMLQKNYYFYVQMTSDSLDRIYKDGITRINNRTRLFYFYRCFFQKINLYNAEKAAIDRYIKEFALNEYWAALVGERRILTRAERKTRYRYINEKCFKQFEIYNFKTFGYLTKHISERMVHHIVGFIKRRIRSGRY